MRKYLFMISVMIFTTLFSGCLGKDAATSPRSPEPLENRSQISVDREGTYYLYHVYTRYYYQGDPDSVFRLLASVGVHPIEAWAEKNVDCYRNGEATGPAFALGIRTATDLGPNISIGDDPPSEIMYRLPPGTDFRDYFSECDSGRTIWHYSFP